MRLLMMMSTQEKEDTRWHCMSRVGDMILHIIKVLDHGLKFLWINGIPCNQDGRASQR
jgi:hypothetical protein